MNIRVNLQTVDINTVFPNVWNPNRQSDFIFQKELTSIKTHGMIDPVLVREIPEGFEIIDGEHRWRACKDLGFTEVPVNNLGQVTESVAKQLTIVMNEVKGKSETGKLSDLLKNIELDIGMEKLVELMPYVPAELESLLRNVTVDFGSLGTTQTTSIGSQDETNWKKLEFRLPEALAKVFEDQIKRFKLALHPGDDPRDVSPVQSIEAMLSHLAQIPDDQLL